MKECVKFLLTVIRNISFALAVILPIIGELYYTVNPPFDKLLAKFNLSWSWRNYWIILLLCWVVLLVSDRILRRLKV